jgi:tetratricopeptide (TPR) repeat protein
MIVDIADLLYRAQEFEDKLERYYAALRDQSQDNGVRLLTYYLSRHRRHLQEALDNIDAAELARVRGIKLKYDVEFHPEKDFHIMELPPDQVKGKDVLEAAVAYDEQLVNLYKSILNQPLTEEAIELLESVIRIEERDIVMLKKMIAMNYF